ncbi:MAG: hypothetical protein PHR77_19205, partial [Kiritimatiellae bacterium]|nr:hypothetical protein [Kiritimatiellia bacterium]
QAELYNLHTDISEKQDMAAQQPERVARMRVALAAWRRDNHAQGNVPNPDFSPDKFRTLYRDVDASRFNPATAGEEQWKQMWEWRKTMNSVLPDKKRRK